jgi:hypothetical protein
MRDPRAFLFVAICLSLIGCSQSSPADPPPVCLDAGVDPNCVPAYEPTYDAVFTNTLRPSCAKSGVSCHAVTGKQGDLDFSDAEASFAGLSHGKVSAGKPECSILVHRVIATDGKVRMPPGQSLPAGEQCAIIKWIADGAQR